MDREIRKSGLNLALAGVLGIVFFWLTDPVWGIGRKDFDNPIDVRNQAFIGTTVGIVGSVVVLVFGIWIATRKVS